MNWFFKDRFSWFDLILIMIMIEVTTYVLEHLSWS